MADKPNTIVSPKGTLFGFVNILKADTKYNPAGDYKFKAKFPKAAPGLSDILDQIESARDKALEAFKKDPKNKGKRGPKMADLPFYEDESDGTVVISFKSKASWVDSKTGETKTRVIPVFGGAGRLAPDKIPQFGEGSEVKVAFTISGFCNVALGAGASLRIDSVKLIKPVAFTGGGGANHFGDDDEGGYVPGRSDDDADPYGDDNDAGGGDASPEEDEDF